MKKVENLTLTLAGVLSYIVSAGFLYLIGKDLLEAMLVAIFFAFFGVCGVEMLIKRLIEIEKQERALKRKIRIFHCAKVGENKWYE